MRWIFLWLFMISSTVYGQWKEFKLASNGDTMNRVDLQGKRQGPWLSSFASVRGEPGYEEEGYYHNGRKEGEWRLYSLMGDLIGIEFYRWGLKDSICRYFTIHGNVRVEQGWKAMNPDKEYDTFRVQDLDELDTYRTVIVKNEGVAIRHGNWKYYDPVSGALTRSDTYSLGKLENEPAPVSNASAGEQKTIQKPREVLDFEKKNSGKKKIRYRDGSTGG